MLVAKKYATSIFDIPYEELFGKGYRGIIFDVDNTLGRYNPEPTDELKLFFEMLDLLGFKVFIISNGAPERIEPFCRELGLSLFMGNGYKPLPINILKAIKKMGTNPSTTLFVGDQTFSDILGANIAGCYSIQVDKVDKDTDPVHVKLHWFAEAPFRAISKRCSISKEW